MLREIPIVFDKLKNFCEIITGNNQFSEDLLQSTCLRALERSDQFEPGTKLDKWVFQIAKSIWLNEKRRQRRLPSEFISAENVELVDQRPIGDRRLIVSQLVERISTLPKPLRTAVIDVYVEGWSCKHVASSIGVPIGTVLSRLANARRQLREKL